MASTTVVSVNRDAGQAHGTNAPRVTKKKVFKARNVMVTINGTHDLPEIDMTKVKYYIFGRELAPTTGMKHLQGYVEFKGQQRLTAIKAAVGGVAHIEKRRGTQEEAVEYCKKDGDWVEGGCLKKNGRPKSIRLQDRHADLQELQEMIDEGKSDREICYEEPALWDGHKKYVADYREFKQQEEHENEMKTWATDIELNAYQQDWDARLKVQNDRKITWVNDAIGGKGKSVYSKWLITTQNAIRFTNAKTADISYAYNGEEYVIFDLSRTVDGRVNYGVIEDLKNGMLFSGKYKSRSKVYPRGPKIIIMANFAPDFSAFSADRWDYVEYPLIQGLDRNGLLYED